MTRRTITITLLAALAAAAQRPERLYARAYYTHWKPGKQAEGQGWRADSSTAMR